MGLTDPAIRLLAVGQTLIWATIYYIFPAMLLHWEAELGWSRSELTLAITLAVLASAIAAPIAGRIIDRGLGAVQMGVTACLGGIAVAGMSLIGALWQFYALWIFIGIMQAGCLYEPCFALVTRAREEGARRGITAITLVAGFAGTLSFPAVHLLTQAMDWRRACLVMGLVAAFGVAPLLWRGARLLGPGAARQARPGVAISARPVFWLVGTGFALLALAHGALLHHLLPILAEREVPAATAVLAASCIGPMQVAGRLAMVATERRLSAHGFVIAAFVSMAAAAFILLIAEANVWLVGLFVILFGASYGTISILRPVIARELLGTDNFGAKSGGLALIYLTASAASAYLGALIWAMAGYGSMIGVLVGCLGLGIVLNIAARRVAGM